jgi:hypothetical protein
VFIRRRASTFILVLHTVAYISRAIAAHPERIRARVGQFQRCNDRDGLTGILVCVGRRYLQVLEGSRPALLACMGRIRTDPSHDDLLVLYDGAIAQRRFAAWSMRVVRAAPSPSAALAELIALQLHEERDPEGVLRLGLIDRIAGITR